MSLCIGDKNMPLRSIANAAGIAVGPWSTDVGECRKAQIGGGGADPKSFGSEPGTVAAASHFIA